MRRRFFRCLRRGWLGEGVVVGNPAKAGTDGFWSRRCADRRVSEVFFSFGEGSW